MIVIKLLKLDLKEVLLKVLLFIILFLIIRNSVLKNITNDYSIESVNVATNSDSGK